MSRILAVLRRDLQYLRGNVIALLVCMGLVVMPSLYAWFNIAGGWDPYANTGQIKVALANSDEGLRGNIIPFRVNVGERVVSSLAGSTKIGYEVTSEEKAVEGVTAGEYYAAVVIPKDFTTKLLSVVSKNPAHPQLDYYVNEKRNAIASIVTGKASGSVQTMVDEGFTEAVSEAVTELIGDLSNVLDDDGVLSAATNLDGALDKSLASMRRSANDIAAYKGVIASIRSVTEASGSVLGTNAISLDVAQTLQEAANGVGQFQEAAQTAEGAANSAIDAGIGSVQDVEAAIDDAFEKADGDVDQLVTALNKAKDAAATTRDGMERFSNALEALNGTISDLSANLNKDIAGYTVNVTAAHTVSADVSDLLARSKAALGYLNDLVATLDKSIADIQTSKDDASASQQELKELAAQARQSIDAVRTDASGKLSSSLGEMVDAIEAASSDAANVSSSLHAEMDKLPTVLNDASTGLRGLEETLDNASIKIDEAADKVETMRDGVRQAVSTGDIELVRTIFGADSAALVNFLTAPVELDREAVFPVENNGSAMTPYYTTMALWVGGTLMGILIYVTVAKDVLEEIGAKPRHAYFGRLAFFLMLGACQSTMLLLGDLFFLKVQCVNPLLFMLTGWLASTVFINIVYALAASFGDVGKGLGVLIMVIQVAGSGGTFPVQMLPTLFQSLYRFLPFVYTENAFRAAMFGTYGNDWLVAMGTLALYLVPALLLGLVLRKPLVGLNEWMEEKLEETKLM